MEACETQPAKKPRTVWIMCLVVGIGYTAFGLLTLLRHSYQPPFPLEFSWGWAKCGVVIGIVAFAAFLIAPRIWGDDMYEEMAVGTFMLWMSLLGVFLIGTSVGSASFVIAFFAIAFPLTSFVIPVLVSRRMDDE